MQVVDQLFRREHLQTGQTAVGNWEAIALYDNRQWSTPIEIEKEPAPAFSVPIAVVPVGGVRKEILSVHDLVNVFMR